MVLFGLPGAFTPLCSSQMVLGYDGAPPGLLDLGIDEVHCLSVNDAFVLIITGMHIFVNYCTILYENTI